MLNDSCAIEGFRQRVADFFVARQRNGGSMVSYFIRHAAQQLVVRKTKKHPAWGRDFAFWSCDPLPDLSALGRFHPTTPTPRVLGTPVESVVRHKRVTHCRRFQHWVELGDLGSNWVDIGGRG